MIVSKLNFLWKPKWPDNMSGHPRICSDNARFWPDIVRWPAVISSPELIEFSYFHNTILLASLYWIKFIIEVRVFCFSTKTYRWRKLKITSGGDFSQPSSKHHSFAEVFLVSLIINLLMWGEKQDFEINMPAKGWKCSFTAKWTWND